MKGARFHPLAERELEEAIRHYEGESRGLGLRFLDEVEHSVHFLRQHPEAAPRVLGPARRLVLPRFPYYLIYRPLAAGRLRILAVGHEKRRPGYWIGRR